VFGRERLLAGLQIPISQNHSNGEDLLSGMEVMDFFEIHNLKWELQKEEENINKGAPPWKTVC